MTGSRGKDDRGDTTPQFERSARFKAALDGLLGARGVSIGSKKPLLRLATEAEHPKFWWELPRTSNPRLRLVRDPS
ncbi:MAG: hypothetical protein EBZ48_14390 [Proteobacteria bacterium]|nr:hypothetical protein [Pseudomonadota bacterium]